MKKFSLKLWIEKIKLVAIRFPFALFFLMRLSFLFLLQINKHGIDIKPSKWVFFSLGIGLTISVTLFVERFKSLWTKIGFQLVGVIVLFTFCWFLPDKFHAVNFYQIISIGIVFILSIFFVSFFKKDNDISFWEFGKTIVIQLIVSYLFAQILFAGLSLAVMSLKVLFKIDIHQKIYEDIAVICFVLFAPIYFLANLTAKDEMYKQEFSFPKFMKILGLYILAPILALYSLILYVYLAQIIAKWQLPNGWVSTLVSILGLGGFLTMIILYPLRLESDNKVVKMLSKYFSLLLLPLLVLMSVGIFRRLGDYGITINRLYVLILNIWFYGISLYLLISKANHLKWIVISFAAVLLFSSVGPWNVYHITKRKMMIEIGQLLEEAKLLKNGKMIDNSTKIVKVDTLTSKRLSEDIKYVYRTYGSDLLQPYFNDSIQKIDTWELDKRLGIKNETIADRSTFFYANIKVKNYKIEIENYKSVVILDKFNEKNDTLLNSNDLIVLYKKFNILLFKNNSKTPYLIIPLKNKISAFKNKENESYSIDSMTIKGDNYKLIISHLSGDCARRDSVKISNIRASLFIK